MSVDDQPAQPTRVTFRPSDELLALLNEAAERADRSLSAEINSRLERTFREEKEGDKLMNILFELQTRLNSIERSADHIKADALWAVSRHTAFMRYFMDGWPLPDSDK